MKKNFSKKDYYLIIFGLAISIGIIIFITSGLHPFGNRNLMAMDAYNQYYGMIMDNIRNSSDFSFNANLGFNRFVQSAYYSNSPFWIILKIVPERFSILAIHSIILLKFALGALAFAFWLNHKYKKLDFSSVVLSIAYAFSGYTLSFINQFMWMDTIILLPIIVRNLELLWFENKSYPYVITMSLALYTNFYLFYALSAFLGLYAMYLFAIEKRKGKMVLFIRFISFSVLSVFLVAFMVLPTYKALSNTISSTLKFEGVLKVYKDLVFFLSRLLPFQSIGIGSRTFNIYFGFSMFVLAVFYLIMNNKIVKIYLSGLAFILFVYLSLNVNLLDYIWHGFHYPNQLAGRQAFVFIFVALTFSYKVLRDFDKYKTFKSVFLAVFLIEIFLNSFYTLTFETWKANHENYVFFEEDIKEIKEKYLPAKDDYYRIEFANKSYNQGIRYDFPGVGYYSSLMSKDSYEFFESIGYDIYAKKVSTAYRSMPANDTILGVRYIVYRKQDDKQFELDTNRLVKVFENGRIIFYENPNYMPLIFTVDSNKLDLIFDENHYIDAVENSNKVQLTKFSDTEITGKIKIDLNQKLFTTINQDGGWKLYVDGVEKETSKHKNVLLMADLEAGDKEIRLIYSTPYKNIGIAISVIALIVFVLIEYSKGRKKQNKRKIVS